MFFAQTQTNYGCLLQLLQKVSIYRKRHFSVLQKCVKSLTMTELDIWASNQLSQSKSSIHKLLVLINALTLQLETLKFQGSNRQKRPTVRPLDSIGLETNKCRSRMAYFYKNWPQSTLTYFTYLLTCLSNYINQYIHLF